MSTLLLRIEAPMQSWGTVTRGAVRQTYVHPSKSGVVGLLANALGRKLEDNIDDLAALRMGVRIERRGSLLSDFSAVQNVARSNNGAPKPSHLQTKMYLADACFLVAFEGKRELLESLLRAVEQPARPLFFGRRNCIPSAPLAMPDGLVDVELVAALEIYPWFLRTEKPASLVAQVEDPTGTESLVDVPVGSFSERRFGSRRVRWFSVAVRSAEEVYGDSAPVFF